MKTSFPKDQIKAVLLEGIHPRAVEAFRAEGFKVESIAKALEGRALEKAVARYAGEKGNLRFPLDEPIPYALIARIVKLRARQDRKETT